MGVCQRIRGPPRGNRSRMPFSRQTPGALLLGDGQQAAQPARVLLPGQVRPEDLEYPAAALGYVELEPVMECVEVAVVRAQRIAETPFPTQQPAQVRDRGGQPRA